MNDQTLSDADASLPVAESTLLPAVHITPMFTNIIVVHAPITPMHTLLRDLLNYIIHTDYLDLEHCEG